MSNLKMPELNKVHLAGRLTNDPHFQYTESGKAVARLNLAVNQSYKDKNNEWQQETSYVSVIAWEKTAEAVNEHLKRGSAVLIDGKLKSRQVKLDDGKSWTVLETVANMSPKADFMREFTKTVSERIQASYDKELEAFYKNIYDLLELSVQEKVIIIQSLEKSGEENGVRLTLTDEEKAENEKIVNLLKLKIRKGMPDIFKCNIVYLTKLIPLVDIFEISIDNESVKTLLSLKVQSKKIAKPINLKEGIIKALMVLNLVKYPVPRHSIIQEGREQMKEANQKINGALLSQLLSEVADARAEAEAQAEAEALNNSTSAGDDSELVSADASGEN